MTSRRRQLTFLQFVANSIFLRSLQLVRCWFELTIRRTFIFSLFQLFFPFPHTSTLLLYLMIFSRVKFHIRISHGFVRSQLQLEMPTRCEDEMERAQSIFRPDDCSPALQWRVMGMGELKTRNFKLFNLESSSVCKRSSSCVVHEENFLEKHSDMLCLAVWKNGKCVHKYISEMN